MSFICFELLCVGKFYRIITTDLYSVSLVMKKNNSRFTNGMTLLIGFFFIMEIVYFFQYGDIKQLLSDVGYKEAVNKFLTKPLIHFAKHT